MRWCYGVTTHISRRDTTLPITLESLRAGGFNSPHLFIDGCRESNEYKHFGLDMTCRYPVVKTFGNWSLSVLELLMRDPQAERFAIFQDDFITSIGLREYLESCQYPPNSYLNLFTFRDNEKVINGKPVGWYESSIAKNTRTFQTGRGAVALVFSRDALQTLLHEKHFLDRPFGAGKWWRGVDGGVVCAMNKSGFREYVHNPSLIQHIGEISSMGNAPHAKANTFRGEEFDLRSLIQHQEITV